MGPPAKRLPGRNPRSQVRILSSPPQQTRSATSAFCFRSHVPIEGMIFESCARLSATRNAFGNERVLLFMDLVFSRTPERSKASLSHRTGSFGRGRALPQDDIKVVLEKATALCIWFSHYRLTKELCHAERQRGTPALAPGASVSTKPCPRLSPAPTHRGRCRSPKIAPSHRPEAVSLRESDMRRILRKPWKMQTFLCHRFTAWCYNDIVRRPQNCHSTLARRNKNEQQDNRRRFNRNRSGFADRVVGRRYDRNRKFCRFRSISDRGHCSWSPGGWSRICYESEKFVATLPGMLIFRQDI